MVSATKPAGDMLDSRRSWVMVFAAGASMFTVFGVGYSFGVFFSSITEDFGSGSGATATVFGITICLSFILSPFTGGLADRLGPRPVLWMAAAFMFVGLVATTAVPNIALAYLSYGVGVGVAIAAGYVPMVAIVSGWFQVRRAQALGVAVAGIGLGTLVAAPLSERLISATSWRTAYLLYAFVGASALIAVSFVVRPGPANEPSPQRRPIHELLKIDTFRYLYLSLVSLSFGLFVPFVFIAAYAEDQGISSFAASWLVATIGGTSILGRLALGFLATRVDANQLFRICFVSMALSQLIWLVADASLALLVTFASIFGVAYGGFIALSPAVAATQFGMKGLGGVLGAWYSAAGIGALFGPSIAGRLVDAYGWSAATIFALIAASLAAVLLLRLPASPADDPALVQAASRQD